MKAPKSLAIMVTDPPRGMRDAIIDAAQAALTSHKYRSGELDIAVVNAREMRKQHREWMGDGSVTDVLTFDLRERPREGTVEAQLVVCLDIAKAISKTRGGNWRKELLLYVVHGCLHLCGFDDLREKDAAAMHRIEDRILSKLGHGRVFADDIVKSKTGRR